MKPIISVQVLSQEASRSDRATFELGSWEQFKCSFKFIVTIKHSSMLPDLFASLYDCFKCALIFGGCLDLKAIGTSIRKYLFE